MTPAGGRRDTGMDRTVAGLRLRRPSRRGLERSSPTRSTKRPPSARARCTWYTSTPVAAGQHIANEFQKQYGIKVEMLRTGGQGVIRRFLQEVDGGRVNVDVMTMSDMSAANAMTGAGLFVPFKPVDFDKVIAARKEADGHYIAQRLDAHRHGGAHRQGGERPTCRRPGCDLTTPKYKGQAGDGRSVVHGDPADGRRHAVAQIRLAVLRGSAPERHADRAGPRAGLRHGQARRAR